MKMTWRQLVPNAITLVAMSCGFFSILVTLEGMGIPDAAQHHRWAAQLIMLAMILDGLDGNIARRLKGASEVGAELDTYVDMTAFGIAPALLIYVVSLQASLIWRVLMTTAIVLSGVVRLARFKAHDPHRGQLGYRGLPITVSAGWVAVLVYFSHTLRADWFSLSQGSVATLFIIGVMIFIVLQVSNVRYPKPSKRMVFFVPSVILVLLLFVPLLNDVFSFMSVDKAELMALVSSSLMVLMGTVYVVFGPWLHKKPAMPHVVPPTRNAEHGSSAED